VVAPLVIPLAIVAATGGVAAAKGVADIAKSRSVARDARVLHEATLYALEIEQKPVHECVAAYGHQQLDAVTGTIGRFADWIERNQMAVNRLGHDPVEGVEISIPELPEMENEVKQARSWITGGLAGASAAVAAPPSGATGACPPSRPQAPELRSAV
jgi:hypothetical protein